MQIKSLMFKLFDLLRFSPIFQTHQLIGCPDSKSNQLGPSQLALLNLPLSCGFVLYSPDMAAALEITDLPQPKMIDLISCDGARYGEQPSDRCRGHGGFALPSSSLTGFLVRSVASLLFSESSVYLKYAEGRPVLQTAPLDFLAARIKVVVCSIPAFLQTGWLPVEPQLTRQRGCSYRNPFAFPVSSK